MNTSFGLFEHHQHGDLIAFGDDGQRSYGQFRRDIDIVAAALPPPRPGSQIAVACGDRYRFAVLVLAAWQRGHGVSLPPNGRPRTLAKILTLPNVVALFHDDDTLESGRDARPILALNASGPPEPSTPAEGPSLGVDANTSRPMERFSRIERSRPVVTVYTSGTTGPFQPHIKTASQLFCEAEQLIASFGLGHGCRFIGTVPPHHIYGLLWTVLVPLFCRAAFARQTPFHAEAVAHAISTHQGTTLITAPAHLRALELLDPGALKGLKHVFSSTAPLAQSTTEMLAERHELNIVEVLGSSETGGIAYRQGVGNPWTALAGVHVGADADGHLLVDSPFLAPDAQRPFTTQDRVAMEPGGTFRHLGRMDDMVKVGGRRISLRQLEAQLMAIEGVSDAAILAVSTTGLRGTRVLAVAVAPGCTPRQLRDALCADNDRSVVPRRILLVDKIPREPNGKRPRQALLALLGEDEAALSDDRLTDTPRLGPSDSNTPVEHAAHHNTACPTHVVVLQHERGNGPRGDEHRFGIEIPEDLFYFQGHFPGNPILPGVCELHEIVLPQVATVHPEFGAPTSMRKLKFRKMIRPGDTLQLRLLSFSDNRRVDFEIERDGQCCASGQILWSRP